jgi:hypothetical protein
VAIHHWTEIADRFRGCDLLLGNGFSRRFTDRFGYSSLFEEFLATIREPRHASFQALGSTNFEFLLEALDEAVRVNAAFSLDTDVLRTAREELRNGLIAAIQHVHPRRDELDLGQLHAASKTLDDFGDVFTLNYDALLYHVIMISLDRHRETPAIRPFNDRFYYVLDQDWLQFMTEQKIAKYKHVYYLHGALFIFRRAHLDVKIRRADETDLIERIGGFIRDGHIPLFVSEGSPEDKLLAISRSECLRLANEHLSAKRERLVVYGASLSVQDKHVADAIRESKPEEVAVSVHTNGKSADQLEEAVKRYRNALHPLHVRCFAAETLF